MDGFFITLQQNFNNKIMQIKQEITLKLAQFENSLAQIMKNNEKFQQILEKFPIAILITDFSNNCLFCNQNTYLLLEIEPAVSNQELLLERIFKNKNAEWKTQFDKVLNNENSFFETTILSKTDKLMEIIVYSQKSIFNDQNCVISFLNNISDERKNEREMKNEQQKNRLIIDSIPAMIFIKDKENNFLSVNKAFEEQTGLKQESVFNKSVYDLTLDSVLAVENWNDDLEVIETGFAKRNIIEPLFSNKQRWFLTDKIPYKNIDGDTIGIIGFSIDISEHKHAEDELLRSEKMFRLLFETAPDGIILSSIDGKIQSTNKAIEDLLGYSSEEMKNFSYFDITPEKWHKLEADLINEAIQNSDKVKSIEKEFNKKDKGKLPAQVTGWIIQNELGSPVQLGSYVKDISIEKKAEKLEKSLLQKEKEQLEKDLESKNKELNLKITKLIEFNALVKGVISKLEIILTKDSKEKNKELKQVMSELMSHTNDDLWKQMELTFGQIHQSFYNKLFAKFPNLTRNEKKLCAFLKMNLSTKDISSITHQTIRSIEVARARLRAKMNLKRSDSLTKFFSQI